MGVLVVGQFDNVLSVSESDASASVYPSTGDSHLAEVHLFKGLCSPAPALRLGYRV